MRITAGSAKGRKVRVSGLSRKSSLRPSSSKVREALFDIIGPEIEGARFLDLYAGTGAVGIEALSRGARRAVFVEADHVRAGLIRRTIEEFGFAGQSMICKMPAVSYLQKALETGETFALIFADPPYRSGELEVLLPLLGAGGLLAGDGMLLLEHSSRVKLPKFPEGLKLKKRYRYGDSAVTTFTKI